MFTRTVVTTNRCSAVQSAHKQSKTNSDFTHHFPPCAVYCGGRHFPAHTVFTLCFTVLVLWSPPPPAKPDQLQLRAYCQRSSSLLSLGLVDCLHQLHSVSGPTPEFVLVMTATQHYDPVVTSAYVKLRCYCVYCLSYGD